jgi:threonine synthase
MTMGENHMTISPAMDIQYAYNLERMLYFICNEDGEYVRNIMTQVEIAYQSGVNTTDVSNVMLSESVVEKLQEVFLSCSVSDEDTLKTIQETYSTFGFALCPHSAVGVHGAQTVLRNIYRSEPIVCVLTAHPAKFEETFQLATGVAPPPSPAYDVSNLKNMEQKFIWLRKTSENWRQEWIDQLKHDVNGFSS